MSHGSRHLARRCAVQALYQWDITAQDRSDIETSFISDNEYQGVDKEYFSRLVSAVPQHCAELDDQLKELLDRSLSSVDPVERAILRLGAYEMIYHPEIPLLVIIDEAVELARVFGTDQGYRYVNGVLDRLAESLRETRVAD